MDLLDSYGYIFTIVLWIGSILGCIKLAYKEGLNVGVAGILSIIFGPLALIVYALI